ncbi:hypothetical protein Tco_1534542 [Tanacetum coccineum]
MKNDLKQTKKLYSSAITKHILRVKKLETQVKTTKARRRARLVVLEDEDAPKDSSKQGRKISEIDEDPTLSLVQDEGMTWVHEDAEIQEKNSDDTEIILQDEEPTELVEDCGSGEKGEKEVSTVNVPISTACATPEVSTAAANFVYIRRSAEKRKDKGKPIMREDEYVKKKSNKAIRARKTCVGSQCFTQYKLERVRERDGWREYVKHTKECVSNDFFQHPLHVWRGFK